MFTGGKSRGGEGWSSYVNTDNRVDPKVGLVSPRCLVVDGGEYLITPDTISIVLPKI